MERPYNFAPGPAMLPLSVLQRIQAELLDYRGSGFSILEASHRGPLVQSLMTELRAKLRLLLSIPDGYDILFCQGGGRLQFAMIPMNLLGASPLASYIVTGAWSKNAAKEVLRFARPQIAFSGNGTRTPENDEINLIAESAYCYFCDNETIHGVEFPEAPQPAESGVPLVADMSSNFLSRPVDAEKFGLFWACAQKNFGISGLAVVVIRRDLLGLASPDVPTLMNYGVYSRTGSIPNTPPIFQIYVASLMADWVEAHGGAAEMDRLAKARSSIVYRAIDEMPEMYVCRVEPKSRSRMNVCFRLRSEALTQAFVAEAAEAGLLNLSGHRSVGGLRASMYNSMPVEGAEALARFMKAFAHRHGPASVPAGRPAAPAAPAAKAQA